MKTLPVPLVLFFLPSVCLAGHSLDGFSGPSIRRHHSQNLTTRNFKYQNQVTYRGEDFLQAWNFFSDADPTHGMVDYQTREEAIKKRLAYVQRDGRTVLAVDNTTKLPAGKNRASVRISSPETYNGGLFIADFQAMPFGCSVWPAWWTVGPDWPNSGEIDILEGVHNSATNQITLHTSAGCSSDTSPQAKSYATGAMGYTDCSSSGSNNMGCSFTDHNPCSYGKGFNKNGGGVYAHLWNSEGIKVWFFPRNEIPQDICKEKPEPLKWGKPVAAWRNGPSCDIAKHFSQHGLTIDTTLCGDWAGATFNQDGCRGTCADTVRDPRNFDNARWVINYISVYQAS